MSTVDKNRFKAGHYIGLPANFDDLFVKTRIELVRQIPGFVDPGLELVDVGCGNGNSVFLLSEYFKYCTGLDIFPENEKVFNEIKANQHIENCHIELIDLETEEPGKQFDRLVCFEVIEHFRDENSVAKLYELIKPGGMFAITVPHKWWIFETHGARLPLLPWNRVPFFSWLPRRVHERYANARIYTKKRIVNLLRKQGFIIGESKLMTAPLDVLPDSGLKKFLLKNVFRNKLTNNPFLATNVFVWGRREL